MIKISSFSPLENFAKTTWEFYDDHLVIKVKSLTLDYETEVSYEKIKIIRNRKIKDLNWVWAAFVISVLLGLASLGLDYFCMINSTIVAIEKAIGVLALILLIPAFRTQEFYSLLDGDKNYLAIVEIDKNNKKTILEVIHLIKQKTELIGETYLSDSLPSTPPVFQITEFDFPDFLNRARVNFYEDKLIEVEKSLAEEASTVIRYDEFSGKTKTARIGNDKWDIAWSYWLIFVCMVGVSTAIFFAEQIRGSLFFLQLIIGGLLLLIPIHFLKYIKNEILIFYDKKENGIFWLETKSTTREKLNQIVEFVQEKVARKG